MTQDDWAQYAPRIEFLFDNTGYGGSWDDALIKEARVWQVRALKAEADVKRLREALAWYADDRNWDLAHRDEAEPCMANAELDGGQRARLTLKGPEGERIKTLLEIVREGDAMTDPIKTEFRHVPTGSVIRLPSGLLAGKVSNRKSRDEANVYSLETETEWGHVSPGTVVEVVHPTLTLIKAMLRAMQGAEAEREARAVDAAKAQARNYREDDGE